MANLFHAAESLLSKQKKISLARPESGYLPYACHFKPDTILTKNGELLQVIKLVGYSQEILGANFVELRKVVRQAIHENINNKRYGIWFHTIRTRKNIDPGGKYNNYFSDQLHEAWNQKNYWNDKYVNELYITILHEGLNFKQLSGKNFLNYFSYAHLNKANNEHLDKIYDKLNNVTTNILEKLSVYGAKKLKIEQNKFGLFSELLQFLVKIITLKEKKIKLPIIDLADRKSVV